MKKQYVCPTHGTTQVGECIQCMQEFSTRKPAKDMTIEERATTLENMHTITTIPFANIKQRICELVGREVFTFELSRDHGGLKQLAMEVRSKRAATLNEILAKFDVGTSMVEK